MNNDEDPSDEPLRPELLASGLAEVYQTLGPLYRKVSRTVDRLQPQMGMSTGVRAVLEQLQNTEQLHGTEQVRGREQASSTEQPQASGGLSVPQMARAQELSRQFVQRMVNEAAEAGWVQAQPNPAHRKSPLIIITEAGREAIGAVVAREHQLMGQVPGGLTDQEIRATLKVLTAMSAGLDDVRPDAEV